MKSSPIHSESLAGSEAVAVHPALAGRSATETVEPLADARPSSWDWAGGATLLLCGMAVLGLGGWAYRHFIEPRWLPIWDESLYYPNAVRIWHALHSWDLRGVARETWKNHLMLGGPFLSPYFLALGLTFGGTTLEAARAASLAAGILACGGIAWVASTMVEEGKAYAAAVAATLWATSPLFLFYTTRAIYDSFALAATAFCLVAAARFAEHKGRGAAVATGLLASAVMQTKCNIGVLLIAALFWGLAYPELRARLKKDARGLLAPLAGPWFLLAAATIIPVIGALMVDGVKEFVTYLQGFPFNPMSLREYLLTYPRALFQDYVPVAGLGVLIVLGILYWTWRGWGKPAVRVVLLYVLLQLTAATLHPQKDVRFVLGSVALACALTGAFLAKEIGALQGAPRLAGGAVLASLLAYGVWMAPTGAQRFFDVWQVAPTAAQSATLTQGLNFIRDNTRAGEPLFVAGVADRGINGGMVRQFLMDPSTGKSGRIKELPPSDAPGIWGVSPEPSLEYAAFLAQAIRENPAASVAILYHEPGSPFRGHLYPWINAWQENYGPVAANSKDLRLVNELDTHAGLRVRVYHAVDAADGVK